MPLPFLKPKHQAGLIMEMRKPDGSSEETGTEDESDPGLMSAAEDLIRAIHAKDAKGAMEALKSAFEMMDAAPHEEGPHTNESED